MSKRRNSSFSFLFFSKRCFTLFNHIYCFPVFQIYDQKYGVIYNYVYIYFFNLELFFNNIFDPSFSDPSFQDDRLCFQRLSPSFFSGHAGLWLHLQGRPGQRGGQVGRHWHRLSRRSAGGAVVVATQRGRFWCWFFWGPGPTTGNSWRQKFRPHVFLETLVERFGIEMADRVTAPEATSGSAPLSDDSANGLSGEPGIV